MSCQQNLYALFHHDPPDTDPPKFHYLSAPWAAPEISQFVRLEKVKK